MKSAGPEVQGEVQPTVQPTVQPDAFWETRSLEQMSDLQWESLCDGCGRCCLLKLEDIETDETFYTRVSCRLLDIEHCRCSDYKNRAARVPGCLSIRKMEAQEYRWLPESCAYRRLSMGQGLAPWHPLITGDPDSVKNAGLRASEFCVSEVHIDPEQLQAHIIVLSVD